MYKGNKVTTVDAMPGYGQRPGCFIKISYIDLKVIGNGSFGIVYQAELLKIDEVKTKRVVAIKHILQNKNFINRELGIMKQLNHNNIVKLLYFFYFEAEQNKKYLSLIMEYMPDTLTTVIKQYKTVPLPYVKLYTYQLFRSLAYLHSFGICHRDIKPENLLLNTKTGILKLCDFGCAKHLVEGKANVSYICSRFYRAPEILFSATQYTTAIDIWSAGCVLAELLLGRTIFLGESSVDQLVEIIKVLGTPTKENIKQMNKAYADYTYPHIDPQPWQEVFKGKASPETIDLVSKLLVYTPSARITPLQACAHEFFDKLREPGYKLLKYKELSTLFTFSEHELKIQPDLNSKLIPSHLKDSLYPASEDCSIRNLETFSSPTVNIVVDKPSTISVTL